MGGRWKPTSGVGEARWSAVEARVALEELARSTVSLAQFARAKGVSTQRLVYWRKRLGGDISSSRGFVEVVPGDTKATSRCIEIVAASLVVRVREDIDVARLCTILDALARRRSC